MSGPFEGWVHLSYEPLETAAEYIGKSLSLEQDNAAPAGGPPTEARKRSV